MNPGAGAAGKGAAGVVTDGPGRVATEGEGAVTGVASGIYAAGATAGPAGADGIAAAAAGTTAWTTGTNAPATVPAAVACKGVGGGTDVGRDAEVAVGGAAAAAAAGGRAAPTGAVGTGAVVHGIAAAAGVDTGPGAGASPVAMARLWTLVFTWLTDAVSASRVVPKLLTPFTTAAATEVATGGAVGAGTDVSADDEEMVSGADRGTAADVAGGVGDDVDVVVTCDGDG